MAAAARSLLLAVLTCTVALAPVGAAWHDDDERTPETVLVPVVQDLGRVGGLVSDGGDAVLAPIGDTLWRIDATGATAIGAYPSGLGRDLLERDAAGNLYARGRTADGYGLHRLTPSGATEPVAEMNGSTFGPDGRLYAVEHRYDEIDGGWRSELWALDDARNYEFVMRLPCCVWHRAFALDGTLYMADWSTGALHTIDVEARAATEVARMGGGARGVAVDTLGRVYVANGLFSEIERYDPATGLVTLVARGATGDDAAMLAWAGTKLFVTVSPNGTFESPSMGEGVAYVETGVEGFPGFQPAFAPAALGDLVAEIVTERAATGADSPAARELVVRVRNDGASWIQGGWLLRAHRTTYAAGLGVCVQAEPRVEGCAERHLWSDDFAAPLAPGAEETLVLRFDDVERLGDQRFAIEVDPLRERFEADDENNAAELRTQALVATPVGGV